MSRAALHPFIRLVVSGLRGGVLPTGTFGNVQINGGTRGNRDATVTIGTSVGVSKRDGATKVLAARAPQFTVTGFAGGQLPNGTFGRVTTGSGTVGNDDGFVIING